MAPNTIPQWTSNFNPVPADAIMQANLDYLGDPRPDKINAGIGMIMDPETGKPFVAALLKKIGREIAFEDNGYLPSHGSDSYLDAHAKYLVFGIDLWEALKDSTVKAQTIGGTNALELSAEILDLGLNGTGRHLLLDPGWPNHPKIFRKFKISTYEHEDTKTRTYNHSAFLNALVQLPPKSVVVCQVGGYNDDGTERNEDQWIGIAEAIAEHEHIPILDFAYNGLVNGWDVDNLPVRLFAKRGIVTFVCVSNSKNIAYNARLASLYIINLDKKVAQNIQGTLSNNIIRPIFSNPPGFAAQTFFRILDDEALRLEYMREVTSIRTRLLDKNRTILSRVLGYDWIAHKRGMFLKLKLDGFNDSQYRFLKEQNAIHGPQSSRLNMGGFDPERMEEIAGIYKTALSLS